VEKENEARVSEKMRIGGRQQQQRSLTQKLHLRYFANTRKLRKALKKTTTIVATLYLTKAIVGRLKRNQFNLLTFSGRTFSHGSPGATQVIGGLNFAGDR
jgi:hypothetical protein